MNDDQRSSGPWESAAQTGHPYRHRRFVKWGDCDPAGIIYTPRVFDYAIEALEAFYRDVLKVTWLDLNWKQHMGSPMVRIECDFIRPLTADQDIAMEVRVERVGSASVTYLVAALDGEGLHYARLTIVSCFISRAKDDGADMASAPIPDAYRQRLLAYQRDCGDM